MTDTPFEDPEQTCPPDTATHTYQSVYKLDSEGIPYHVWEPRELTPEEIEEQLEQTVNENISSKLITVDFPAMQAILDQSNSDINNNPAGEIKDLARAVRRLTRKVEKLLDASD